MLDCEQNKGLLLRVNEMNCIEEEVTKNSWNCSMEGGIAFALYSDCIWISFWSDTWEKKIIFGSVCHWHILQKWRYCCCNSLRSARLLTTGTRTHKQRQHRVHFFLFSHECRFVRLVFVAFSHTQQSYFFHYVDKEVVECTSSDCEQKNEMDCIRTKVKQRK